MRVTTELWVAAMVRRAFSAGGFAAVSRRGAAEAGAVMIVLRGRFGDARLFAPAPQTSYDAARPEDRRFVEVQQVEDEEALRTRIERETRFDPDLWLVEFELDDAAFSELVDVTTP